MARNRWFGLALLALTAIAGGGAAEAQSRAAGGTAAPADSTARASLAATTAAAARGTAASNADTLDQVVESALADSVQRAREIDVMRETFAYGGGTRDPFASLINIDKTGPEIADLDLVGVYLDLRTPSNNVVVLREKASAKRHKMRVGDQLGRARLTQIRRRDAVFRIQDFGFERQETLSLRKQEVETP